MPPPNQSPLSPETRTSRPVVVLAFANDRAEGGRRLRNLPNERRAIQQQLENHVQLEILPDALLHELWEVFERKDLRGRISALHFAGHASGSWLAFEDEEGAPIKAGAGGLAGFLARQTGLVLVFLNGCSTRDQVRRLREGVPAVVATTEAIDDEAAAIFAGRFYAGLTTKPLRQAFLDAADFVKAKYGDDPRGVTRELAVVSTEERSEWPWVLDCDGSYENWRIGGEQLTSSPDAAPTPWWRARWAAWIGVGPLAVGGMAWGAMVLLRPPPPVFEMTLVPAGSVRLCEDPGESSCDAVEVPPFCLSITEMTQAQWQEVHGANPSAGSSGIGDELPVNNMTWAQALETANRLSDRESLTRCYESTSEGWVAEASCDGYRLLTDAEWHRLAREHGEPTCTNANVADYDFLREASELEERYRKYVQYILPFDCGPGINGDGHARLSPVGSMAPGPFGLMDLQGNVAEWVWDEARGHAIVRGHSFAWPGRDDAELDAPVASPVPIDFHDLATGVRYARRPRPGDPGSSPRCPSATR